MRIIASLFAGNSLARAICMSLPQLFGTANGHQTVNRRDLPQKQSMCNRFARWSLAQQVFAKLAPSQPERSFAEDQRLCARLAGTAQRIAGSLLRPTYFIPLADNRSDFCLMTPCPEGQDGIRLDNNLAPRFGLQKVSGMKPSFRSL